MACPGMKCCGDGYCVKCIFKCYLNNLVPKIYPDPTVIVDVFWLSVKPIFVKKVSQWSPEASYRLELGKTLYLTTIIVILISNERRLPEA